MAKERPTIPKGTRDFAPEIMVKRDYIFDTIKNIFRKYAYQPLETPSMENMSTLTGKYGEEGDKLLFSILDSGDFFVNLKKTTEKAFETFAGFIRNIDKKELSKDLLIKEFSKQEQLIKKILIKYIETKGNKLINSINDIGIEKAIENRKKPFDKHCSQFLFENSYLIRNRIAQKGLRYDLTVPFARFVVQHRNEITFPFKRYQIQPVWRADKPQKGRYREFYQCDVDVIGSDSLLNEVELIKIIDEVFNALNLRVTIKINNRKILKGLAEYVSEPEKFMDITVAIDKLEKIGMEKVKEELKERGLKDEAIEKIGPFLQLSGDNSERRDTLKEMFSGIEEGEKGIAETDEIFEYLESLELTNKVEFDPQLARGLDYYTGTIFEVKAEEIEIGSICGGGRYDDLTGVFGLKDVSGVGISFGAERIFDIMKKLNKFPAQMMLSAKVLFVNFGKEEAKKALSLVQSLREQGITAELYPDSAKMKKQFTYANNLGIPYVAIIGEHEMQNDVITVKQMATGEQKEMTLESLIDILKA